MSAPATLLVNADDFGLHRDINRGILDCVERGRVQSVSFSPIGRAIDWRKLEELSRHGVRIGIHLTLVGEPWATDGRLFRNWRELAQALLFSRSSVERPMLAEIRRQFQLCADSRIAPAMLAHIDSHQHVHLMNPIWRSCLALAREHRIPRVRVPWCPSFGLIKKRPAGMALQTMARRRRAQANTALPCLGLADAGRYTVAMLEKELNATARAGRPDVEFVAHPGVNTPALESCYPHWNFQWTRERDALLSEQFKKAVAAAGYAFPAFSAGASQRPSP